MSSGSFVKVIQSLKISAKLKDKNRNDAYYWVCDNRRKAIKCTAKACTTSIGDEHEIRSFDAEQHHHAPVASKL